MVLKISEHIEDFETRGFTVFRNVLPASLITQLREVTDRGREQARQRNTSQTQRIQPLESYDIDLEPFREFVALPELNDVMHQLLSDRHYLGKVEHMAVLLEPGDLPWATGWHRDLRDNYPALDMNEWKTRFTDIRFFNQVNCPLYEDNSFWAVPGSHHQEELEQDVVRFKGFCDPETQRCPQSPFQRPELDGLSVVDRERACLDYCKKMPGAVRMCLDPGDFAIYRNTLWHLGNYIPYRKRATLHTTAFTPEFQGWYEEIGILKK